MITFEQAAKVDAVVRKCFDMANTKLNASFAYPVVEWNPNKSTVAGRANSLFNKITLHVGLFLENEEDFYTNTIPHECAHIIADKHYNTRCKHDHRWKYIMQGVLGVIPDRCHTYDTTNHRRAVSRYIYTCACPAKEHKVTTNKHKRLQQQARMLILRHRIECIVCKTVPQYTGRCINLNDTKAAITQPRPTHSYTNDAYAQTANSVPVMNVHGSKMDRARALFREHRTTPRYIVIDMFVNQVGLTPAGASTYYYNLKKEMANG